MTSSGGPASRLPPFDCQLQRPNPRSGSITSSCPSLPQQQMYLENTMKKEPRITPSKLGALCGENPCYRCFWCLLRMSFKKPFDFGTPYVMQLLDQLQKQVAKVFLAEEGELPEFFGAFRSATKIISLTSMSAYHRETDLHLYGMPDLVFENKDGSRMILDNKTAFPKSEDEALFYKYQAQVNFYGFL